MYYIWFSFALQLDYYRKIVGPSTHVNNGRTVAYRIIDDFLDRNLLTSYSWTGAGDGKMKFCTYGNIVNLIFQIVLIGDPNFTLDNVHRFFKDILKHAKVRAESNQVRQPTARLGYKKKKKSSMGAKSDTEKTDTETGDDDGMQSKASTSSGGTGGTYVKKVVPKPVFAQAFVNEQRDDDEDEDIM